MAEAINYRLLIAMSTVRAQSSPEDLAVRTDCHQRRTYGHANGTSDYIKAEELVM
jgi:hypothetical protein